MNIIITSLISIFTFLYATQKQILDETTMFKNLFTEFNQRYDKMNKNINDIYRESHSDLSPEQEEILDDYFNLCAEEYLFYKKGHIDPEVWKAWCNGMKFFLENHKISKKWDEEEKTNSYYGLTRKNIELGSK